MTMGTLLSSGTPPLGISIYLFILAEKVISGWFIRGNVYNKRVSIPVT